MTSDCARSTPATAGPVADDIAKANRDGYTEAAHAVEENLFAVWDEWRRALASDNPDPGAWNVYLAKWMRAQAPGESE